MGFLKNILYRLSNKRCISLFKNQSIFPYYHIVNDEEVPHVKFLYKYKNLERFKKDLDFLTSSYTTMHPKSLLKGGITKNTFLLSFDDGLQEMYSVVFPVLKEKGIKAIFFINPEFINNNNYLYKHGLSVLLTHLAVKKLDQDFMETVGKMLSINFTSFADFANILKKLPYAERHKVKELSDFLKIDMDQYLEEHCPYLTLQQIQEMIDGGFYFGGHTMSHPPLLQIGFEEQKKEIEDSIAWLQLNFNIEYSFFAFPFTDKGISKKLINSLFADNPEIILFGNSGLRKDINTRIIQRFSIENPDKHIDKVIIAENMYKYYHKFTGKYLIKRK